MKRNVLLEAQILKAIEVLGEATDTEILDELKEQFTVEISAYEFLRAIRRWLAKKCITVGKINGENAYKLRDVPPFFKSLQIFQMKGLTANDAEAIVAKLEQHYQALKADISKEPLIGDYHLLECTFETLDRVAGGDASGEDRFLEFPKKEGKPYIRRNWLRGLFRDNARLANINESFMAERIGYSDSEPLDAKLTRVDGVKVAEGLCSYETIPQGTTFTVRMRFPFRGSKIKSIKDLESFCKNFEDAPIKGLGAYSNYFGGRIGLKQVKETTP
ncbi:hypothetical protein MUP79_08235 [Candidatus Bathyarchaeota archaeon]|nr:hypothetical protein [Candidatus Bathyarchaeota archaeon]